MVFARMQLMSEMPAPTERSSFPDRIMIAWPALSSIIGVNVARLDLTIRPLKNEGWRMKLMRIMTSSSAAGMNTSLLIAARILASEKTPAGAPPPSSVVRDSGR